MKKYIIAGMLLLLPTVSYAKGCDCCVEKYFMYTPINATTTTFGTMIMRGYACGSKSLNDTGIKKLIGKMVHRTKPIDLRGSIANRSYIDEPRKLLAVTDEYLILSSDILARGQFEIDRAIWDDGNWEEVKPQRLTVVEIIGGEIFLMPLWTTSTKYSCVRCGKKLACSSGDFNYYCIACKTGFNIKEE